MPDHRPSHLVSAVQKRLGAIEARAAERLGARPSSPPRAVDDVQVLQKAVRLLLTERQSFRHMGALYAEAAGVCKANDVPMMAEFCRGQSASYGTVTDHLDEIFADAFDLWAEYEADIAESS